ncbi:MAG TPA: hypothetical protein PLU30_16240 [Verrucomicrobiae bacterium]|nr:hypothetical protein [Verrucomicrobiae bacterium]
MASHDIAKALEIWTLQNLFNVSILCGILSASAVMVQRYLAALEKRLTLRVSIELWQVFAIGAADALLLATVLIGYLVLNPDIMADIKMAVPFCQIATVLFAAALVLRLFHDGHQRGNPNFTRSLQLMWAANVLNVLGFTIIMEAPSGEYLASHPSPFWTYIKTHLRSNADPAGLELSQATFYVCFPLLMAIAIWAAVAACRQMKTTDQR